MNKKMQILLYGLKIWQIIANNLAYYWLNPGLFGPNKALWGLFSTSSVKFDPDILGGWNLESW